MAKNANGRGSMRKRTDRGKPYWEGRITVGTNPETGKPIVKTVTAKTQKECSQKLDTIIHAKKENSYVPDTNDTVADWLNTWFELYTVKQGESTKKQYRMFIDRHIIPFIGKKKLQKLTNVDIDTYYNTLTRQGLNARSVKLYSTPLRLAMKKAVKLKVIQTNPCEDADLPERKDKEIKPFTPENITHFLSAAKGDTLENLFAVELFAGLRGGEAAGLAWDCVDFDEGTINVRQQLSRDPRTSVYGITEPKCESTRLISPPAIVFDYLRAERAKQNQNKLRAGAAWDNPWNLVFTNASGKYVNRQTYYHHFRAIANEIGRPDATPHTLRHSTATMAIASGADVKSVQHLLGHADASMTLNVYAGISQQQLRAASQKMNSYFEEILQTS